MSLQTSSVCFIAALAPKEYKFDEIEMSPKAGGNCGVTNPPAEILLFACDDATA